MSAFHLYTACFGVFPEVQQRAVHYLFASLLLYLTVPASSVLGLRGLHIKLGGLLAALSGVVFAYIAIMHIDLEMRIAEYYRYEVFLSAIGLLLVIDGCRRTIGLALPIVAVMSILYGLFGPHMPGIIAHKGYSLERLLTFLFLTNGGVFGIALGVSATFVFMFILIGAFLEASGAGKFFIDLSNSVLGRVRGGPALVAVIASALFGTISGSPAANVVGTGTFTIPLMKSLGYPPHFAGGVEATASTGGALMPPVMGAVAFLIAENLEVSYLKVCIAAAIPAILYYIGCFASVYLTAVRLNMKGLDASKVPKLWPTIASGWHLLFGPGVLVALLLSGRSPMRAGFFATLALVLAAMLRKRTRMGGFQILFALEKAAKSSIAVAATTATVGIVIGVIMLTGLGMKLSNVLITLAGGNVWILLVFTMVASLILGMGLPSVPCYIILAVIVAPTLTKTELFTPMGIHLCLLYYGMLSFITPPVAVAAYVAAGLAGSNPIRTAVEACKIGSAGLIIPFVFITNPVLLFEGSFAQIAWATTTAIVGVVVLAAGIQGCFIRHITILERTLLLGSSLMLIKPGLVTDAIGFFFIGLVVIRQIEWSKLLHRNKTSEGGR